MRNYRISKDLMQKLFKREKNILWNQMEPAIKELFVNRDKVLDESSIQKDKNIEVKGGNGSSAEILFIGENIRKKITRQKLMAMRYPLTDWKWYVSKRTIDNEIISDLPEEMFHNMLVNGSDYQDLKRIYFVHGKTGYGKTTFIRHFFYHWIKKTKAVKKKYSNYFVIRVSASLLAIGGSAEAELDNRVHGILKYYFPFIYHDDVLKEMIYIQWKDLINKKEFDNSFPKNGAPKDKLNWAVDNINNFRDKDPHMVYHDFNRVIFNYLIEKYDWHFTIVLDNLDQTPLNYQEEIYMLCRHKLDWLDIKKNFTFVVGVRSYLLDSVKRESSTQAYNISDDQDIKIFPPAIKNVLLARLPYVKKSLGNLVKFIEGDKTIVIPVDRIIMQLKKFITKFSSSENDIILSKLSNFNVRYQLKLVNAILKCWQLDLYTIIQNHKENKPFKFNLSQNELMQALLKQDNKLVCPPPKQLICNIYNMGDGDHFSSSLNGWYVLKIISHNGISTKEVQNILYKIGHKKMLTKETLQNLLDDNIITSKEGNNIKKHKIRKVTIDEELSTTGYIYLDKLSFDFDYLHHFAYLTKMDSDINELLDIPKDDHQLTFRNKLKAALLLYKQIERDEKAQNRFAETHNTANILYEQGLVGFANQIRSSLELTLQRIQSRTSVHNDISIREFINEINSEIKPL